MTYYVPVSVLGGSSNLTACAIGYSNILFGIAIVSSFIGDGNINFLGLCYFDKKFVPWYYMLLIYLTIPKSSFMGHFCGILAGLVI